MKILIANSNPVHKDLEAFLSERYNAICIHEKAELNKAFLTEYNPDLIFFPHWSFIIPSDIYEKFECIVFHMTDLPFGRGGSPLQNLVRRGFDKTKLSAIRVVKELDAGDIYLKKELSLLGSAEEIFLRAGMEIKEMIAEIIDLRIKPVPQTGNVTNFKRLTPEDGDIKDLNSLKEIFDFIRMLDAEGYPNAFLETENIRIEFSRASLKKDSIIADVRIFKK